ncbi:WASH complex subunit 3 [Lamellibrachia satsuma]|nr:WASH complex subunit 3 [Lamellibrachia satsuma]
MRVQRLDTSMRILEAKLSSIPGLDDVTVPSNGRPEPAGNESTQVTAYQPEPDSEPSAVSVPVPTQTAPETETTPLPEPNSNPVSQDPRYIKFFKMLKMGVPPPAIKLKMTSENVNPDLLDTPDAPAVTDDPQDSDDSERDSSSEDSSADFSD